MPKTSTPHGPLRPAGLAFALMAAAWCGATLAATTDIGSAPLFTSSANAIKPNIMFIMDDSGSMRSDYLPDNANFSSTKYGKKTSQCNGVAYNPNVVYTLPIDATGASLPAASLAFITANAITQTSGHRNLDPIGAMPAVGDLITVKVTNSDRRDAWYDSGSEDLTVFQSDDGNKYFVGNRTSWDRSTGNLTIKVTRVAGSGAISPARIGYGEPKGASYFRYSGSEPRLSYSYTSSGVVTTTTFYKECNSAIGSSPGKEVFTEVFVTNTSPEAQNYANWYQYYRTRMAMMKSSISLAFRGIDNRYRVGYSTITDRTAVENTDFLDIRDFDVTQKTAFYTRVDNATPTSYTPLRGALAKAGQYYAKKAQGQTVDPVQYSCQRNFAILSTDGYWNTQDESSTSPKYGPYQVDNLTEVGQQDGGGTPRPMLDGGSVSVTTTERFTRTVVTTSTIVQPKATTTSSSSSTTTYTVVPEDGQKRTFYTLLEDFYVPASGFSRSGTTVTVTKTNHGLVTGDQIDVSGGSGPDDQDYRRSNAIVTVISPHQFSYTVSSTPGTNFWGTFTIETDGNSCSDGRGRERAWRQTRYAIAATTTTVTNSTVTESTTTFTRERTEITPYTRTYKVTDGVIVSDTGDVPGTVSATNNDSSSSTVTGTPYTTSTTSTTGPNTSYSDWLIDLSVAPVSGSCRNSPRSPTSAQVENVSGTAPPTSTSSAGPITSNTNGTPQSTPISSSTTETSRVTTTDVDSTGGTRNSLADVAMYYYKTDLRTGALANCTGALGAGVDVCANNVPGIALDSAARSFGDSATWQHMTTFTLGLGVSGLLRYDPNYLTQQSGDFFDITNFNKNWPVPGNGKGPENIDDLWHAAVNGRGQYFSAGDPASLALALSSALDAIKAVTGSASAASTSSLQPVEGDNDIYVAQFTTQEWVGDVLSFKISPTTGQISTSPSWSAKDRLDTQTAASRTIYYANPGGGSTLRAFTYANLAADGYATHFDNFCAKVGASGSGAPQQCALISAADQLLANTGANLVNYLRGDQSLGYYRTRRNLLGDIINASPLFVGKPGFKYTENNYQQFVTDKAGRTAVVLAAANDGMLHAFDRNTGNELWAYVPSFVIPNLYKLADTGYANNHSYFVDGSPQIGDVYVGGAWKTIVVGGLNAGGRGYYALDVTDPSAPKLMWEFRHDDLGLSFGNPVITKRTDGTWVVVFGSGYNNVGPGDGNGHMFVVNAGTGALITKVSTFDPGTSTPVGTTTTPSGLAKLNVWVDSELANVARRFYGGDLLGNLWRFDIDGLVEPHNSALLMGQMRTPGGAAQSITVKPALAEVNYNGSKFPAVYVATGRYLGTSDLTDTAIQSVYALKDPLANTGYGVIRSNTNFGTQTITASGNARTSSGNAVDWMTKAGWRVDLPVAGERVSVNPQLALETLYVGTNLPKNEACTVGGESFLYEFNIAKGTSTAVYVGNVLIQGLTLVQLTTGAAAGSIVTIITRSDGTLQAQVGSPPTSTNALRRTSWRELVD